MRMRIILIGFAILVVLLLTSFNPMRVIVPSPKAFMHTAGMLVRP